MALAGYSKLQLEIDVNGNVQQWTTQTEEGFISLNKQVRYLKQELGNPAYNDAQRAAVRNLLADAQIGLQATQTRSRELFGSLSLLPGPLGQFASVANTTLIALRELSQLSFADLQSQFNILKSTFTGKPLGPSVGNTVENVGETAASSGAGALAGNKVASSASTAAGATAGATTAVVAGQEAIATATAKTNLVIDEQIASLLKQREELIANGLTAKEMAFVIKEGDLALVSAQENLALGSKGVTTSTAAETAAMMANLKAKIAEQLETAKLALAEKQLAASADASTTSTVAATVASEALAAETGALEIAIEGLDAVIAGLGGAIVALGLIKVISDIKEWATNTAAATAANDALNASIKETEEALKLTTNSIKRDSEERVSELKAGNAKELTVRQENINALKLEQKEIAQALEEAKINEAKARGDFRPALKAIQDKYAALKALDKDNKAQLKSDEINYANEVALLAKEQNSIRNDGSEEALAKQAENVKAAGKQVIELTEKNNEAIIKINVAGNAKLELQRQQERDANLRNIEAEIQQEERSADASASRLLALYKKRDAQIDVINKDKILKNSETDERNRNNFIKANNFEIDAQLKKIKAVEEINKRGAENAGKDTKEQFDYEKAAIEEQYQYDVTAAKKIIILRANSRNVNKDYNAAMADADLRFKQSMDKLDEKRLAAKMNADRIAFEISNKDTADYFAKQETLENDRYAQEQQKYKNNATMLELIEKEHQSKLDDIKKGQYQSQAKIFGQFLDLFKGYNKDYLMAQKAKMDAENKAEEIEAGDDIKKQALYNEHKLERQRQYHKEEWAQYDKVYALIAQGALSLANTLGNIADQEMQAEQGRNKSRYEAAKVMAEVSIGIKQAVALGKVVMSTSEAVMEDIAEQNYGRAVVDGILGALQAAEIISAATSAISSINSQSFSSSGGGGGGGGTIGVGKNYASGGMIYGPDHSQGGVNINAQGGEAVMTRGAVTAFGPLLSMMNQAGGGVAFNNLGGAGIKNDNPKVVNGPLDQPIIKTYVVEGELTSIQHKNARLKSLSTL